MLNTNILASYKDSEEGKVRLKITLSQMKHLVMENHRYTFFGLKGAVTHVFSLSCHTNGKLWENKPVKEKLRKFKENDSM